MYRGLAICSLMVLLLSGCQFDSSGLVSADGSVGATDAGLHDAPPGTPDATMTPDAIPPDAAPSCDTLCPGVCDNGTCVIDCNTVDCGGGVTCPPGLPCHVVCGNAFGCAADIDCSAASSCDIDCTGYDSCSGTITCGGDACSVTCSDTSTCDGAILCAAGDDCKVDCSGYDSCSGDIRCTQADDCQVVCGGSFTCGGEISCVGAGDCDVDCTGYEACDGNIMCGGGDCDVLCDETNTCAGKIDCSGSCACGVDCKGFGSCPEGAMCLPACEQQKGCMGNGPCDSCP